MASAMSSEPVSADVILRKVQTGQKLDDLCSLCTAGSGLMQLNDKNFVHLSDEYNDRRITMLHLVRELHFDCFIDDIESPMICEVCVQNLCNFLLFKTKCKKIKSGLVKLTTLIQEDRLEKVINVVTLQPAVVLPYKNIHDYEAKETEIISNREVIFGVTRKNCYQFVCNVCNETLKRNEVDKHVILHYYKRATKNIVCGKSFCVCCLIDDGLMTKDLNSSVQKGDLSLSDVFGEVFGNEVQNLGDIEICSSCFQVLIKTYNFKKIFLASTTITKDCVKSLETCSANPKTAVTILSDGTDHAICLLDVYNMILETLSLKKINMLKCFLRPMQQTEEKCVIKPKPFLKNQLLSYEVVKKFDKPNKNNSENIKLDNVPNTGSVSEETIISCHICMKEFNGVDNLLSHKELDHSDLTFCPYCDKSYNDSRKALVQSHMKLCVNVPKKFLCDLCNGKFNKKQKLIAHRVRHFPPKFECRLCSKKFWLEIDLRNHQYVSHNDTYKHDCFICVMQFDLKSDLRKHLKTHNKKTTHRCRFCAKIFNLKDDTISHKCRKIYRNEKITGETKSETDIYRLKNSNLRLENDMDHLKVMAVEKKLMCSYCDYKTNYTHCLESHINKKHKIIRPYSCQECKKSFISKLSLNYHIKIHHSDVKFVCTVCNKSYMNKKSLMNHVKTHPTELFSCDICNENFDSSNDIEEHCAKVHTNAVIKCNQCNEMFSNAELFEDHVKSCHCEKKEVEICNDIVSTYDIQ